MKTLEGIIIPLVTPMTEGEEVDAASLAALVDYLVEGGVDALYPCGTTGEVAYLTSDERKLVVRVAVEAARGRVPVFAQVGAATTYTTIELARHAVSCGADGIGIVTPWYHALADDELFDHYRRVIESVPASCPVYLYGIPQNAVNDISVELAGRIADAFPNVVGIKYSCPDMGRLQAFMSVRRGCFDVLVGSDDLYAAVSLMGGKGVVSGNAMVLLDRYRALHAALREGDVERAARLQHEITPLNGILCRTSNIAAYKAVLARRGVIATKTTRMPLRPFSDEEERLFEDLRSRGYDALAR